MFQLFTNKPQFKVGGSFGRNNGFNRGTWFKNNLDPRFGMGKHFLNRLDVYNKLSVNSKKQAGIKQRLKFI